MYASVASPRCLSAAPVVHPSPADPRADGRRGRYGPPLPHLPPRAAASAGVRSYGGRRIAFRRPPLLPIPRRTGSRSVFCMAPDEEKMTRRSPLDFPIEWERPKPGRRPDIFPQFSPMKTPLPPPLPADPPEEDEEEEEKKEEEEDPETEEPEKPEKPEQQQKRAEWWWT